MDVLDIIVNLIFQKADIIFRYTLLLQLLPTLFPTALQLNRIIKLRMSRIDHQKLNSILLLTSYFLFLKVKIVSKNRARQTKEILQANNDTMNIVAIKLKTIENSTNKSCCETLKRNQALVRFFPPIEPGDFVDINSRNLVEERARPFHFLV